MTENIIIAILLFAAFATLLILLISNRRMRKNSEQPTLRELERQYKKLETDETVERPTGEVLPFFAFRPAMSSALMTAVVALLVVSPEIMQIINNGPNPCDVKKINFNPNIDCPLEISNNDFWSCI